MKDFGAEGRRKALRWIFVPVLVVTYLTLGLSTFDLLYRIPGERYLLDTGFDGCGLVSVLLAPLLFIASLVVADRALIPWTIGLLILAVTWTIRLYTLLLQL